MKSKKPKKNIQPKTLEGARIGQYYVKTPDGKKYKAWYGGESILLHGIPKYKFLVRINRSVNILRFNNYRLLEDKEVSIVEIIGQYQDVELTEEEIKPLRLEELFDGNFKDKLMSVDGKHETRN